MSIMESQTRISVRVHPGAARNEVVSFKDGVWQIKIAAPPVKGKANRELIAFLGQRLGVKTLTIIRGHTARNKLVAIDGLSPEEIIQRLAPA